MNFFLQERLEQPWAKNKSPKEIYADAHKHVISHIQDFQNLLFGAVPFRGRCIVDIKSEKSFIEKMNRKPANKIHDVLRGAILTEKESDLNTVVKNIHWKAPVVECEFKSEPAKDTGYRGSYHLKVKLDDMICEIQVMTEALWAHKHIAHGYYVQARQGKLADNSIRRFTNWLYDTALKSSPK